MAFKIRQNEFLVRALPRTLLVELMVLPAGEETPPAYHIRFSCLQCFLDVDCIDPHDNVPHGIARPDMSL